MNHIYHVWSKSTTRYDDEAQGSHTSARIGAMLAILFISLFAVSFPSVSKRVAFIRIPRIIFFIGKHFGTGVILSTAFAHLLQDAFTSLHDPAVLRRWDLGRHTGLITLGSLLSIFLIEYISTSYVDRLQSYSSPPASPKPDAAEDSSTLPSPSSAHDHAPLINGQPKTRRTKSFSYGSCGHQQQSAAADSYFFQGHHRHESRSSHVAHHDRGPRLPVIYHDREASHVHTHTHGQSGGGALVEQEDGLDVNPETEEIRIGKKRQIVGIIVLQLGIMIHSLVIGLTLSITTGPEFTSLLIALIFHQLFEGLSLGIRIALLPSSRDREFKYLAVLKPILSLLFAITTPIGIALGILIFGGGSDDGKPYMLLTRGLMAAISAGMLIYAACVEMLAADFVMDPTLWRSSLSKQGLALLSLVAGVVAMALVG
ncbi:zinc iron permease [Hygrophoropsis aurantiaca]|uniref:Zinc iron permease n=1 Tax=Hygrophoropsis aurantiaca TaxID=72124 RepID=A0ACB8AP19_9AGAM|nr:zinc iron permease [Hygrophoropsis aurantiaca]